MRSVTSQSKIDKMCIYLHCIDLSATEEVVLESFPCLKVNIVLGHITFPGKMAERRISAFPFNDGTGHTESREELPVTSAARS